MAEEILLNGHFKLGSACGTLYNTCLTEDYISFVSTSDDLKIHLKDVIGAKVEEDKGKVFLHVYTYPLAKHSFWSDELKRRRKEVVFCVDNGQNSEENRTIAHSWVENIRKIIYPDTVKNNEARKLKFVVFVNPFGGQGFAMKTFKNEVKVMLEEADVDYEMKTTEYTGHAKEIAQNLDVKNVDCLLFCSGDGLIHEVVNGLMNRPDWKEAILTPLGHIPCGSGNGLCAAVLCKAKEPFDVTSSVFTVLRGHACPLDVVKAETCDGKIHYSFLGIVHGIVADVDICSEKYRVMGDLRFVVMALIKITSKYCYKGEIWYLPDNSGMVDEDSNVDQSTKIDNSSVNGIHSEPAKTMKNSQVDTMLDDGGFRRNTKKQMVSDTAVELNSTSNTDGGFDGAMDTNIKTVNPAGCDTTLHINGKLPTSTNQLGKVEETNSSSSLLHNDDTSMNNVGCHSDICTTTGIANEILPNMSEPLPANWRCIKGNFVGWVFTPLSHIGSNAYMVPEAKFGGGILYCIYLMEDMSRRDLIEMISGLENGDYFHLPGVNLIKAKAFRFDMASTHSSIATIDGECVKYGKMQAEVFAGLARVRCR